MKKFLFFLILLAAGVWAYRNSDTVSAKLETWMSWARGRVSSVTGKSQDLYVLTERVAVSTGTGVRAVAKGTEVRLLSQEGVLATVDDGHGTFEVLASRLSRDPELRTGPRYQPARPPAEAPAPEPPTEPQPTANAELPPREQRLHEIERRLLSLAGQLRDITTHDPAQGRIAADEIAATAIRREIRELEEEKEQLLNKN